MQVGGSGMAARAADARGRLVRSGIVVAIAMTLANVLGYVLTVVASRRLGPAQFGVFAAMLGLVLLAFVVALGVQTVVARHLAAHRAGQRASIDLGGLVSTTAIASIVTASALLLLAPALQAYLHLASPMPVVWTALTLVPLTWTGLLQGAAQGLERFGLLAGVFLLSAVGKVGGGLVGTLVGGTADAAMLGTAVGTLVGAAAATVLAGPVLAVPARPDAIREILLAAATLLAVLVITNLDLLLARHYLPPRQAGMYSVGSVITKIAYWLPQFVPVVALPRMVDRSRRDRATALAIALVAGAGAAVTLVVAVFSGLVVAAIGGPAYAQVAPDAWWFAALGALFALTQLLAYGRLARENNLAIVTVWVAVVLEFVVITANHDSVLSIVQAAATVVGLLVVVGLVGELPAMRRALRSAPDGDQLPAGHAPGR